MYLQSAIAQIHDNCSTCSEPFLEEDGVTLSHSGSSNDVTTRHQVVGHVLREVEKQRALTLVLNWCLIRRECDHVVTEVVIMHQANTVTTVNTQT